MFNYYSASKSNVIPSGYPVCTAVNFKANGDFIPVSFGVEINQERFRYQIKAIKSIKDIIMSVHLSVHMRTLDDYGRYY